MKIDLSSELTFKNAFLFPLQSPLGKYEIFKGGLILLIPAVGWILNMGHRINFVHRMQHGKNPWPAWKSYGFLFKNGFIAMLGMIFYYLPGTISLLIGIYSGLFSLQFFGGLLIVIATIAIPGFMSHYCKKFDVHEIFNPLIALRRSFQGGKLYWKAWAIALTALMISFLGLFIIGIGFLFTSVWFWQVAGYSFSNVFAKNFNLLQ